MDEYINRSTAVDMIQAKADTLVSGKEAFLYVAKWLELLPTADVVNRADYNAVITENAKQNAEIERLTVELDAMRGAANSYKLHYENLAREIFEEIDKTLDKARRKYRDQLDSNGVIYTNYARTIIAELEQKYKEKKQ